ncbi:uncharacterized protein VTP21DRAFT_5790 [Calcarisporiella thermophila]|uniref:uncharacterized protein n=1 Tax=Calcarisporiella thermophila TaxID=911321 RepID=UPI003744461F
MKVCCFCFDLRTGVLVLSLFGTITQFWNAIALSALPARPQYAAILSAFIAYSWMAGLACLAGFAGVVKNNFNYIRAYSIFYIMDVIVGFALAIGLSTAAFAYKSSVCDWLIHRPDLDLEISLNECLAWYTKTAVIVISLFGIFMLVRLHFLMAVWGYYRTLLRTRSYLVMESSVPAYAPVPVEAPPAYENVMTDVDKDESV